MLLIVLVFCGAASYALGHVVDSYLSNSTFKNVWSLAFFSILFNSLFFPLLFLIDTPGFPPLSAFPLLFIIGSIQVTYPFLYYRAFQLTDTSVVSALFSLGHIFVPPFAYFFVGELLHWTQYLGLICIIAGSFALNVNRKSFFRPNKAFFYMALCSCMLALETVLYKYLFDIAELKWSTAWTWGTLCSLLIMAIAFCIPSIRKRILPSKEDFKKSLPLFVLEEFLSFCGSALTNYALVFLPATVVKSVGASEPLFALGYAFLLKRFFPKVFKEDIDRHQIIKKTVIFMVLILGIVLVIGF